MKSTTSKPELKILRIQSDFWWLVVETAGDFGNNFSKKNGEFTLGNKLYF